MCFSPFSLSAAALSFLYYYGTDTSACQSVFNSITQEPATKRATNLKDAKKFAKSRKKVLTRDIHSGIICKLSPERADKTAIGH